MAHVKEKNVCKNAAGCYRRQSIAPDMVGHENLKTMLEISDEEDEPAGGLRRPRIGLLDNCESVQVSQVQKTAGSGMPTVLTPHREQVGQACDRHILQTCAKDNEERPLSVYTQGDFQVRGMERRYDLEATPMERGYGPAWTRHAPKFHTGIKNGTETCDYDPEHPQMDYMPRNADRFLQAQDRSSNDAQIYARACYDGGYPHKAARGQEWVDHYGARGHEYRHFPGEARVANETQKYTGAAYNDQYFQERDRLEYTVRNQVYDMYEEPPRNSEYAPGKYRPGARRDEFDFCDKMRWEDQTSRTDRYQDYRDRRGYVLASEQWV
jgi:hypothetical protein